MIMWGLVQVLLLLGNCMHYLGGFARCLSTQKRFQHRYEWGGHGMWDDDVGVTVGVGVSCRPISFPMVYTNVIFGVITCLSFIPHFPAYTLHIPHSPPCTFLISYPTQNQAGPSSDPTLPPDRGPQGVVEDLLQAAARREGSSEHLCALLVALLRSQGHVARTVRCVFFNVCVCV